MLIERGGIYVAALDPAVGREIAKTRPVIVVSNDKNNQFSGTVTVLPVTSKNLHNTYPFEVYLDKGVGNLPKNSKVKADQIRTLEKGRLVKHMGKLGKAEMEVIETALKIHLDLHRFS